VMEHRTRRDLLKTLAAIAAGGAVAADARAAQGPAAGGTAAPPPAPARKPGAKEPPWYRRLLVGIEWGPTGANDKDRAYMARADGREIIRHLVRARAEYAVVFMKDMSFAYYNSHVARKCPNLGSRDLLRECVDEAAKHGMPVVAYCQIQYDTSSWKAHPEWRMKDPAGNDLADRLCFRSDYLEFIQRVAGEMMGYEIAGFHFDMLDFGFAPPYGCWCLRCRAAFRQEHSIDMPPGVSWDDAWDKMLQFRCDSNTRFCRALQAFVKSRRPGISVDFNYHGYPPFNWMPGQRPEQHAANGDFVTAEGLPFVFGHYNPSLLALFMKGVRADGCTQGVTSRSVYDYHDFTVRPAADLKWEVFTYLAHGAQCTIVDKANYDGTSDPLVYERIAAIFDEARRKRELFGQEPMREVGLYYSHRSRDWFAREDAAKYMAAFWGAHKALVQSHVPLGILTDENLSIERLQAYAVVYLDNYVRLPRSLEGGEGKFLLDGIPPDWPMLTWGPIAVLEPKAAEAFGELLVAFRSQDNMWSRRMSPEKVVGPAVLAHRHGQGRVLAVPCLPDAAFAGDYRMPEHRQLIYNLVRSLNPRPEVLVHAPRNVEVVLARDEARRRVLVHFLGFAAPATSADVPFPNGRRVLPPLAEEEASYRAQVDLCRPPAKAEATGPAWTSRPAKSTRC